MSFRDNLSNGFYKIKIMFLNWLARFREKRARESEIRAKARAEAEPIYWQERKKVILEQEKARAKQRARPTLKFSQSTTPPRNVDFFWGSSGEPSFSFDNSRANYDFLGNKVSKGNKKEQMKDVKWY